MSNEQRPLAGGLPGSGLQLRLVHSRGEATDVRLSVPWEGCGAAAAMELSGERLSHAQWAAANLCRFEFLGGRWHLRQESQTLVCALNGRRVETGTSAVISPGDALELGLLRFEVAHGEGLEDRLPDGAAKPTGLNTPQSLRVAPQLHAGGASFASDEMDGFDLRDLAAAPAEGADRRSENGWLSGTFGVLDIAGAEARSVNAPLAELLGEAPAPRTEALARYADSLMEQTQDVTAQARDMSEDLSRERSPGKTPSSPGALLMDGLHEEFVRVVRDPTHLAGRDDWESMFTDGEQAPTLEELSRQAQPYPLLRDILLQRQSIDQVIEGFDRLMHSDLLDVPEAEDVLHLFAPELTRNATVAVPSLTRREHHTLSPDSHMSPSGATSQERSATGGPPEPFSAA